MNLFRVNRVNLLDYFLLELELEACPSDGSRISCTAGGADLVGGLPTPEVVTF